MGWSPMSFPGSSGLTSVEMTAIASNFYSAFAQESGGPTPSGTWSWGAASVLNAPGSHHFGQITVDSGIVGLLSATESFNSINVTSGIVAPQVSSFGMLNAASGFTLRGFATKQLLQRVHVFDTTSRGSASATFSTYTVASLTPVSSLSTLLVRAGVDYACAADASINVLNLHLMRNPLAVASFAYLTASNADASVVRPGNVNGTTTQPLMSTYVFERVDSSVNLDPKQYGVDWARVNGSVAGAVFTGYVTVEEWL